MPPPVNKIALRVPTEELALDTNPTTYDYLNNLRTHWLVIDTNNGKVEVVSGDEPDPFNAPTL